MNYSIPEHRLPALRTLLEHMDKARRVVLTTHLNADGDGTGCQAALLELLRVRGVEARIVNPTPFPQGFRFLLPESPEGTEWVLAAGSSEADAWCATADLCVVVDTGEVSRIGRVRPMVSDLLTLIIDHHPPGERPLEGPAIRDTTAAAAGELVLDLVTLAEGPWTRPVLEGLYAAILTDTGSFRFSNATPGAHHAVAELIRRGVQPDVIYRRIYESVPLRRYRLLQAALEHLDRTADGRVAWITVPMDRYEDLECEPGDLEGLTDYPRALEGVEVALTFRTVPEGIKVSFRSNGGVDVNRLARAFGGGGHVRASGALVAGSLEGVREKVIAAAAEAAAGGTVTPSPAYSET
jgi:bifunctional oligoribonuclease and PAP phosphatase NrnA